MWKATVSKNMIPVAQKSRDWQFPLAIFDSDPLLNHVKL